VGKWRPNRPSWRKWTRWLSEWCFATAWRRCNSFFGEPRPLRVVGKKSDRGNWCACIGARRKHRIKDAKLLRLIFSNRADALAEHLPDPSRASRTAAVPPPPLGSAPIRAAEIHTLFLTGTHDLASGSSEDFNVWRNYRSQRSSNGQGCKGKRACAPSHADGNRADRRRLCSLEGRTRAFGSKGSPSETHRRS